MSRFHRFVCGCGCEDGRGGRADRYAAPRARIRTRKIAGGEWAAVYVNADGTRDEGKTYYAGDKEDALGTAEAMRAECRAADIPVDEEPAKDRAERLANDVDGGSA